MTDEAPETVTLEWLGRQIVAMQRDIRALRDDVTVMAAILRRVENNQQSEHEIRAGLLEALRHLRDRVEAVEASR